MFFSRIHVCLLLLHFIFCGGVSVTMATGVELDTNKASMIVSDTLNVQEYNFNSWIYAKVGKSKLNAADRIHNYHPSYFNSLLRNDLGNIGSANFILSLDYNQPFGFTLREHRRLFWKRLSDRKMLISPKMFSNVSYTNGAGRENHLIANLTRGFGKLLNLGFSFQRTSSSGFYNRQRNIITDFSFYGTFQTKNEKYKAAVIFDYTDLDVQENGGLKNDSVFELNLTSGRNFIPVNLENATNKWKGFDIGLEQRLMLSRVSSDSVSTRNTSFYPFLSHSFSASRSSMVYKGEANLEFYQNIYSDSVPTYDSTNILGIKNALRFGFLKSDSIGKSTVTYLKAGVGHEYYRLAYDSLQRSIHNLSILLSAGGKFRKVDWGIDGQVMVFGHNIFDARVDLKVATEVKESSFTGSALYSLYRPNFISSYYVSNHFTWSNSWRQTSHLRLEVAHTQNRLRLKTAVQYHLFQNMVVYGTDRLPYQATRLNQMVVLKAEEHFIMKWFHLIFEGAAQFKPSGDEIRVPTFVGRGLLYYQNDIFKRKLRLQFGIETSYATAYFANSYNPALSNFYLQNDKQVGNYPFIDVFLNLRVKKFRAFVKVEHVNAGWFGYTYYQVPNYPTNDLSWKFGVNWAFLD
ncbi:putative porin [Bacteroidota bacterium]